MSELSGAELAGFRRDGFVVVRFEKRERLLELQRLVREAFPGDPTEWHLAGKTREEHMTLAKELTDRIAGSGLVTELVRANAGFLRQLLGPDLEIQAAPHFRLSRPDLESDLVDWHRDTFYGNTPWEMNLWFPLFPLEKGAGLRVLPGSHVTPSVAISDTADSDPFRSEVKKGSVAHQLGYVYAPKSDETIRRMGPDDAALLAPEVGEAVFFFGCCVHRAQNLSRRTRLTLDARVRGFHAPTNTRPGYYTTLCQGLIHECVREFVKA